MFTNGPTVPDLFVSGDQQLVGGGGSGAWRFSMFVFFATQAKDPKGRGVLSVGLKEG